MAQHDETTAARIVLRHFRRRGASGPHTMPFEDLPPDEQSRFLREIKREPGELPILVNDVSREHWCLLTTRRLIVRCGVNLAQILWSEFVRFEVDFESLRAVPNPKEVVDTLEVVTKSGQCVKITTDPGLPFLGFWNGLLAAMQIAPKE